MLKRLRFQLTLLYLFLGIILFGIAGAGAYSVLYYYFQHTTDLALQYIAGREFIRYGIGLPIELENARILWGSIGKPDLSRPPNEHNSEDQDEERQGDEERISAPHNDVDDQFDANLAAIFFYAIIDGQIVTNPNSGTYPIPIDNEAINAALLQGSDWRTVHTKDNTRVRLLTYNISAPNSSIIIQLGRQLNDHDRILSQFLLSMTVLGGVTILILGLASWLLAGRSLNPAQRAWENQQTFVANASHELRTPLTIMRAASEIALRSHSPTEQKNLLQDVIREVDHMSKLVDDLLLLSRLDAGHLKLERLPIVLCDILEDVHRQVGRIAQQKMISLILGEVAGTALGDADRLRQVLLILLDNAIQHTPKEGTIQLQTEQKGHIIQIGVHDNGLGISPEHLPHVFERFYQVSGADREESKGYGLGLSIANSLVMAMGGNIHIESKVGVGTHVYITLVSVPSMSSPHDN